MLDNPGYKYSALFPELRALEKHYPLKPPRALCARRACTGRPPLGHRNNLKGSQVFVTSKHLDKKHAFRKYRQKKQKHTHMARKLAC